MKRRPNASHLTVYRSQQPIHPNAADHHYFAEKAVNIITAIVSTMGIVSGMMFLVTMC